MAMVTILDNGSTKVEVRDDIAHEFSVCPDCHGKPYGFALVGQSLRGGWAAGGWDIYQSYRACFRCDGGVVRDRAKARGEA